MEDFVSLIIDYPFLRRAIIAAVLCSIAFGLIGPFVVIKRLSFLAGGIAHAVMGGIGAAYFLHINTTAGAIATAVLFAFILTVAGRSRNEDTLVSTLWALGMSVGIIFMYLTPGYNSDLASFIFGNILMVQSGDLVIIALIDCLIVTMVFLFYYHFVYISFDEEYLDSRGIHTRLIYFLLLFLVAITVVITIKIVGLILVIAMITLPAVISSLYVRNLKAMMAGAVAVGIAATLSGMYISFVLDIPASACIIICASLLYFISLLRRRARS